MMHHMAPPPAPQSNPVSDNLYITDLPAGINEHQLQDVFGKYGTLKQCRVLQGGSALVRFGTVAEATWIVDNVNANIPQGLTTPVSVRYANPVGANKGAGKGGIFGMGYGAPFNNNQGYNQHQQKGGFAQQGGKDQFGKGSNFGGKNSMGGKGVVGMFGMAGLFKGGFGYGPKDVRNLVRSLITSSKLPGGRKWENDDNTLFVGGLPEDTTDLEMYHIFSPFGPIAVRGASARMDRETGRCSGIGFVNFLDATSSQAAITALHGTEMMDGSKLSVKVKGPAKEKGKGKGNDQADSIPSFQAAAPMSPTVNVAAETL